MLRIFVIKNKDHYEKGSQTLHRPLRNPERYAKRDSCERACAEETEILATADLSGLSLAMVFDKRSTRTRMSFEVAMKQLGGHTIVMNAEEMQITGAESVEDTAKVLSRFVDAGMFRISSHEKLREIAKCASIPIINGLTDHSHPCQIMADLMTIEEKLGAMKGKKIAWFGDYNNVARTFVQAAPVWDFEAGDFMPGRT